jgi:hypothetical protein
MVHTIKSSQGVAFACEAKGTAYTFRLLGRQAILEFLYFPSYVPDCSAPDAG